MSEGVAKLIHTDFSKVTVLEEEIGECYEKNKLAGKFFTPVIA